MMRGKKEEEDRRKEKKGEEKKRTQIRTMMGSGRNLIGNITGDTAAEGAGR
jgi:hypothetical protein